jgi:Caspase domain
MTDTSEPSEATRFQVEANKEIELAKIQLARDQFEYEKAKSSTLTAAQITLLTAVLSLASGVAGAALTGWFTKQGEEVKAQAGLGVEEAKAGGSINLEKTKFETGLIVGAIKTDDQQKAVKTLKFYAEAGLIPDYEGKILTLAETDGGKAIPALDLLKPKLNALVIGIGAYANNQYPPLATASRDAEGLASAFQTQKGGLYRDVQVKVLPNATRDEVFEGLDWLKKISTSRDLSVVYLAGYGLLDGGKHFWFLTRDSDARILPTTAISGDDLLQYIASTPGKQILFLDSCHAGAAWNPGKPLSGAKTTTEKEVPESSATGPVKETSEMPAGGSASGADATSGMMRLLADFAKAGTGAVVFAASQGGECAYQSANWDNHSAFGKALIEAIEGKASTDPSGLITLETLGFYMDKRVKELTGGLQHPVMYQPDALPNFPIALARP